MADHNRYHQAHIEALKKNGSRIWRNMSAKTKLVTDRIRLRCMEDRDHASLLELLTILTS